mgnify:CR=1 FL=1
MTSRLIAGIDFSTASADTSFLAPDGTRVDRHHRFDNSVSGLQDLKQTVLEILATEEYDGVDIADEATGMYWLPFFLELATDPGLDNPAGPLLLSLAELALLLNRSISTVGRYVQEHFERTGEPLPIKGYVLDQGSRPTHKGHILRLYEQGMAPPDIARTTQHSLEAVDRYIKDYERVKVLLRKGLTTQEISHAIGRGARTVIEYQDIAADFHPDLVNTDG